MKNKITSANQVGYNYLRSVPSYVTYFSAEIFLRKKHHNNL
jgi:hypothetical protein